MKWYASLTPKQKWVNALKTNSITENLLAANCSLYIRLNWLIDVLKIEIQHVAKCGATTKTHAKRCTSFNSQRTCTVLILPMTRHILALYVSNILWNIQNSDFTVFTLWPGSPLGTEPLLQKTRNTKSGKKRLPCHVRKILSTFSAAQSMELTSPSSESSLG